MIKPQTFRNAAIPIAADAAENLPVEQRRFRRFSTTLDVEIYWQDDHGLAFVAPAVVSNVSAGGFGIALSRKPLVGFPLTVRTLKNSMQCVVRHARPDQGAYIAGVEILPTADSTTPTQSLERLATGLSAASRASATAEGESLTDLPGSNARLSPIAQTRGRARPLRHFAIRSRTSAND